jgi:hypothetical protein
MSWESAPAQSIRVRAMRRCRPAAMALNSLGCRSAAAIPSICSRNSFGSTLLEQSTASTKARSTVSAIAGS